MRNLEFSSINYMVVYIRSNGRLKIGYHLKFTNLLKFRTLVGCIILASNFLSYSSRYVNKIVQ